MTEPWARPSDDGASARPPSAQPVEIQLDGPDDGDPGDVSGGSPPNWRAVSGAAAVLGVVLGLVIAGVVVWADTDDDEPPTTTSPVDEAATEITTPPTLPPVETTPPPSDEGPGAGEASTNRRTITVPTYPEADDVAEWPDQPVMFDSLDTSLRVVIAADNATMDGPTETEIAWDAPNERFELVSRMQTVTTRTIYDVAADAIYEGIEGAGSTWTRTAASVVFDGGLTAAEYFEQALLGPVRYDNVERALLIAPQDDILSVDGTSARRTTYVMPDDSLGLWGGAGGGDDVTEIEVYTDAAGRVVRIQGLVPLSGSPFLLMHTPTRDDVRIELPDEDDVIGATIGDRDVLPTGGSAESLRPVYETLDPVPANSTGEFSIADALDHLSDRPPAAASVDVLWADGASRISAERDDVNDRRLMTLTLTTDTSTVVTVQIDDGASATTLLTDDVDGRWTRLSNTGQGGRRATVDERLISGVLNRSTIREAEVSGPYRFVPLRDGTIALEAHLVLDPGSVVLPSVLPMQLDPDKPVHAYMYVGAGVVHEFHVLSNQDAQLLVQRFDLTARPEIALPDPSRVIDG